MSDSTISRNQLFEQWKSKTASSVDAEETPNVTEETPVTEDSLYKFLQDHGVASPSLYTKNMKIPEFKWDEEDQARVPEKSEVPMILEESSVVALYLAIVRGHSGLIYGPAGCGKTTLPKYLCSEWNYPFTCIAFAPGTEAEYYLGQMVFNKEGGTEFRLGNVPTALSKPGLVVLDEIYKADPQLTTAVLQSALDDRRHVTVFNHPDEDKVNIPLHEDTRILLTSNTSGAGDSQYDYVERSHDKSTLSRVGIRLRVDYLPKSKEIEMLMGSCGVDKTTASLIVAVGQQIRASAEKTRWTIPFTHRDSKMVATLAAELPLKESFMLAFGHALSDEERNSMVSFIDMSV